jgi:hypothetical protein
MEMVMKKVALILSVIAMGFSSSLIAEEKCPTGKAATVAAQTNNDPNFSWAVAVGSLAVIGVIVGVVCSSATSTPADFGH